MAAEPVFRNDEELNADERLKNEMLGPHLVNELCVQLVRITWKLLPAKKRNLDALEDYVRHVVDRTLRDLRDDYGRLED